ncbi:MAG TPA: replicative DNA helicase [Pyrinomonadaceae bacterium]|nr:replicative DNA helicase [Pyrinomonadaceae bacterium]
MANYTVGSPRDQMLERPLPHSGDAERAILGSIILDNSLVNQAVELLKPDDFYVRAHQFVFRAMIALSERGGEINPILLGEELRREGVLEQTGGVSFIAELTYGLPHFTNVTAYAKVVKDKSLMRQLVKVANKITSEALEEEDEAQIILDHAEQMIFALADERTRQGFSHIKPVADHILEKVQEMAGRSVMLTGCPTGFTDLDRMTSGLQPADLVIIAARPSMGKAQPLTARVRTPAGWVRMGDLRVGDALASVDGAPSFVTGVFPQGEREVFRVTFSDGRSTVCCAEHLWRVHNRKWGAEGRVLQTKEVAALLGEEQYRNRLSVPVPSGDFGVELLNPPVDPWVLGALIGDGRLDGRLAFSSADASLVARLGAGLVGGYRLVRETTFDYRIQRVGAPPPGKGVSPQPHAVKGALKALGLFGLKSHEKFIPPAYLNASKRQRIELLRGLMDTDGTVEPSKTLRFCTTSVRLAADVQALARSLGALASVSERRPSYTHRGERREGRTAYVVTIRHAHPEQFLWLERKRARLRDRAPSTPRLNVVSVERVGSEPVQCIAVSHPSRLYVTDDYVVTHNTAFCLNIAQNAAVRDGRVVGVFSLEMSKESLVMRMLSSEARVDAHRFRNGYLSRDEWARLAGALGTLADAKIYVDDTPGISVLEMRAKARRLAAEQRRLDLIIVDYLQLMSGGGRRQESRQQEVSQISRDLKSLAKELNVPLIALSQLSRAAETRTDHRPQLSDLRESGAIEQDADVVGFIYRDEYYNATEENENKAEIIIAKQRNGPTGTIELAFIKEFTRFEDMWKGN